MVRTGELPTRLLALKYGADLVWGSSLFFFPRLRYFVRYEPLTPFTGPETVDKAIIGAVRTPNLRTNTIDFIKASTRADGKIIFRTLPSAEKGKLIFQLGTASPDLAVEAAKVVAGDVDGIDVNSGCPKHFSIHAGMGAALLKAPDKLIAILTALVNEIGIPYSVPISVKIRLLEPHSETVELVRRLCLTGISRLTVHCRTIPMRPREPAIRDVLASIASVCRASGVKVFANGDVDSRAHALRLCEEYGVDGCMIARAAETNMSVFRAEGALPWREVTEEFLRTAVSVESHFTNTKFCLGHVIPGKSEYYTKVIQSRTYEQVFEALGMVYEPLAGAEVRTVEERVGSKAVEKAKTLSNTVRAASGGAAPLKSGKKGSVRGVTSDAVVDPIAERKKQQATAVV